MEDPPEGRICRWKIHQKGGFAAFWWMTHVVHAADLVHSPEARTGSDQVNAAKGLGKLGGFTWCGRRRGLVNGPASTRSDDELGSAGPGGCRTFAGYLRRPPAPMPNPTPTPTPTPTRRIRWKLYPPDGSVFLGLPPDGSDFFYSGESPKKSLPSGKTPPHTRIVAEAPSGGCTAGKVPFHQTEWVFSLFCCGEQKPLPSGGNCFHQKEAGVF